MRDRYLQLAIATVVLLNLFLLSTPFGQRNYDTEVHLFFADHYRRGWFNPWEVKWYDGMWMWSYPPLAHQLIALFGGPWGVDVGYKVVQTAALLALPVSVWLFAAELIGTRYAGWAALLAVFVPGLYTSLYNWGQLPSLVAMDLGLAALAFLSRFLRTGRAVALITWLVLAGAAATAHHHTVIFILPLLAVVVSVRRLRFSRIWTTLARAAIGGVGLVLICGVAMVPFWWWLFSFYQPQVELPHPSRDGIFRTQIDSELFFWGIYGVFLLLVPLGFAAVLRQRRLWPLIVAIVVLATLGLGTLTPLPALLFRYRDLWQWLVYERFAVWAAVLGVLPGSLVVRELWRRRATAVLGALSVLLLVGVAREATFNLNEPLLPRPLDAWEEQEIVRFLEADDHADWNYLTLGLGEPGMARLNRLTSARTFDGLYYTARERPELRDSGVGSVDAAFAWRTGEEIIPKVLGDPARWNLKWVILARAELQPQLRAAGWTLLTQLRPFGTVAALQEGPAFFFEQPSETQAVFRAVYGDRAPIVWAAEHQAELGPPVVYSRVSIWQAPDQANVGKLAPTSLPPYPPMLPGLWGIVPLGLLVLGIVLVLGQLTSGWRIGSLGGKRAQAVPNRVTRLASH